MVREIMRDEAFLSQKAEPAAPEDLPEAVTAYVRAGGPGPAGHAGGP